MTVQILSGGALVYEPWPVVGDWHMFSGNVDDYRSARSAYLDPAWVWRTQRNVRKVVGFLARNFAQVRLLAYERGDDGDRERLDRAHPLAHLLANPDQNVTEYEFARTQVIDLAMWDRWAAVKLNLPGNVDIMRRLPPRRWTFIRNDADQPTGLRVLDDPATGKVIDIALSKCVWLDGYPTCDPAGSSPMEHLSDLLVEESESTRARIDMWRNGARISGVIERGLDAPEWGKTERDGFARRWAAAFTRRSSTSGTQLGGTPILEDGMKYIQTKQITPEQAEQMAARQLSAAEVASSFFVAPELVGAREGTYSNVVAYREQLYTDTLGPMFQQAKQAYDARLVPAFADPDDVFVEHNVAEKLRLSFEEQARILQTATGAPIMLRNEARQRMNLRNLPEGNELVVPLNVLVGGQASPTDSAPELRSVPTSSESKRHTGREQNRGKVSR